MRGGQQAEISEEVRRLVNGAKALLAGAIDDQTEQIKSLQNASTRVSIRTSFCHIMVDAPISRLSWRLFHFPYPHLSKPTYGQSKSALSASSFEVRSKSDCCLRTSTVFLGWMGSVAKSAMRDNCKVSPLLGWATSSIHPSLGEPLGRAEANHSGPSGGTRFVVTGRRHHRGARRPNPHQWSSRVGKGLSGEAA
jgi:hypothetical protein